MRANGAAHRHRLPPEIIGRISLARFLEKKPQKIECVVRAIESSEHFHHLTSAYGSGPLVCPTTLAGTTVRRLSKHASSRVAGILIQTGNRPVLSYRSTALVRCYRIDEERVESTLKNSAASDEDCASRLRDIRKMRLVNARNQLNHAVLTAAMKHQKAFLLTLDPRALCPLRQTDLVAGLGQLTGACRLDASRASRIIGSASLLLPNGQELPLRDLFPNARTLLKVHLRELLWEERKLIAAGSLRMPFTDAVLARKLRTQQGLPCLPRTVAYCRRALGIPHWRQRAAQGCYLLATTRFSNLHPLDRRMIHDVAPRSPGIYELRLDHGILSYPMGVCPVFYIGSAKNLRKRMLAHLAKKSQNRCIASRVRDGGALFRFGAVPARWRAEERRVYERFVGTFGTPPWCNASRP